MQKEAPLLLVYEKEKERNAVKQIFLKISLFFVLLFHFHFGLFWFNINSEYQLKSVFHFLKEYTSLNFPC